jgi:hypothetical protein
MAVPDNVIGRDIAKTQKFQKFVSALVENDGDATMTTILKQVTDLSFLRRRPRGLTPSVFHFTTDAYDDLNL